MGQFLSCDWGTSSFRLRLVETETLNILAEQKTDQGIAPTFSLWHQSGKQELDERLAFYLTLVQEHIQQIESNLSLSLHGVPTIFSGMASSSIGLKELPYGTLPFGVDGRTIPTALIDPTTNFAHPVLLVSGIRSEEDVMRGEETQLIGVMSGIEDREGDKIFVFPGTHSKHIWVKKGQVVQFKTYMTGEYFDLLSKKSLLSSSVEESGDIEHSESFGQGVNKAVDSNLLNACFLVRTNDLFGKLSKKENYDFLSGLLIATELKELAQQDSAKIYLCCGSHLKSRYQSALIHLGVKDVHIFSGLEIDNAVIRGQIQIYNKTINT